MNNRRRKVTPISIEPAPPKPAAVMIAIPSTGMCRMTFTVSLAHLIGYTLDNATKAQPLTIGLSVLESSLVSFGRERLVENFLRTAATHILFLDDDMAFPPNTLLRLLRWDVGIVGVNYRQRLCGGRFTAILTHRPLETTQNDEGLMEVISLGLGVTLIKRKVLEDVPQPRFPIEWCPEQRNYTGEDVVFCRAARAAGHSIFVDQSLSTLIGHLGAFEFSVDLPPDFPSSDRARQVAV